METGKCPVCGQDDVKVRKDETLYAHHVDGVKCDGSGGKPADGEAAGAVDTPAPDGDVPDPGASPGATGTGDEPRAEDPAEGDAGQDDAAAPGPAEDGPLPETPTAREAAASTPRAEPAGFRWRVTVKLPCPYLDDQTWHQANAQLATRQAVREGMRVTGEARHAGTRHSWDTATLTYIVPIR